MERRDQATSKNADMSTEQRGQASVEQRMKRWMIERNDGCVTWKFKLDEISFPTNYGDLTMYFVIMTAHST
jgi:hypothetical protein